eukprot:7318131-Pyramimonas_sp.AAC.1
MVASAIGGPPTTVERRSTVARRRLPPLGWLPCWSRSGVSRAATAASAISRADGVGTVDVDPGAGRVCWVCCCCACCCCCASVAPRLLSWPPAP